MLKQGAGSRRSVSGCLTRTGLTDLSKQAILRNEENLLHPAPERNLGLVVEYDGTSFSGFQRIPGKRTIQGELERALSRVAKESIIIVGAGRTDSGVHALGQVVSFKLKSSIPMDRLPIALNSLLPKDIVVADALNMISGFHARYSAKARTYEYTILNTEQPSALIGRYSWHMPRDINLRTMRRAAKDLIGVHDFTSFSVSDPNVKEHTRDLMELSISRSGDLVKIRIVANAFLRGMARIIVGTLVEVGQGRRKATEIIKILEARDRQMAGKTAPACGLVLMGVNY